MSKSKVSLIGEDISVEELDLGTLTTDCHGVEYTIDSLDAMVDVVRAHSMVDIFDHYHDMNRDVKRIWVLGGRVNPKLGKAEIKQK